MNESHAENLSSNFTVSSTMKRSEIDLEDSPNFTIGNMIDDKNSYKNKQSNNDSEKRVQSSSSPISTTQLISTEIKTREPITGDAESISSMKRNGNTYNISNADTTTVQGNDFNIIFFGRSQECGITSGCCILNSLISKF